MSETGNGNGSKLEAFTESVSLRLVARGAMIITPLLLGYFGILFDRALTKLDDVDRRLLVMETRARTIDEMRGAAPSTTNITIPPAALPPPGD